MKVATLAEASAQAAETSTPPKGEGTELPFRERLLEKLKTRGAEGEPGAKKEKPKAEEKPEKPEKADSKAKTDPKEPSKDKAKTEEKAEEKPEEDPVEKERNELRAQKRQFNKYAQKTDAALKARESQVQQAEAKIQELFELAKTDPVAFVKRNGGDLRALLLRMAEDDSKDPTAKRLEEAERLAREAKEEAERLRKEREQEGAQQRAVAQVEAALAADFRRVSKSYPLLVEHSSGPEEIAAVGAKLLIEHYRKTSRELDPETVFAKLQKLLQEHLEKKQTTAKAESPDRVRTVAKSEAVNPEGSKKRPADVSHREARITAETQIGRLSERAESRKESFRERQLQRMLSR